MTSDGNLLTVLSRVRKRLEGAPLPNEQSISQSIVLPVLAALGWDIFDAHVVCPEYSTESRRRVDFALKLPSRPPMVFIEVKQPNRDLGADRQLFEYSFHEGIPIAVLTTGVTWDFYLPSGQGEYEDRRFYRLDLTRRADEESSMRLERYLGYSNALSGEAVAAARADYDDRTRRRTAQRALPTCWKTIVESKNTQLLDVVTNTVEDITGVRPMEEDVWSFLISATLPGGSSQSAFVGVQDKLGSTQASLNARGATSSGQPQPTPSVGFTHAPKFDTGSRRQRGIHAKFLIIDGSKHDFSNANELAKYAFCRIEEKYPGSLERFYRHPKNEGSKRRFIGHSPEELYPDRNDLQAGESSEFLPGWYMGTNVSNRQKVDYLIVLCELVGLRWGIDLQSDIAE